MSLSNLKCKLIVLKEKIAKLKLDSEDLNLKYEKVNKIRKNKVHLRLILGRKRKERS